MAKGEWGGGRAGKARGRPARVAAPSARLGACAAAAEGLRGQCRAAAEALCAQCAHMQVCMPQCGFWQSRDAPNDLARYVRWQRRVGGWVVELEAPHIPTHGWKKGAMEGDMPKAG